MKRVICCEHNRCPDRPAYFLGRFTRKPWRCDQCGRWWVTKHYTTYANYDSGGDYRWVEVDRTDQWPVLSIEDGGQ